MGKKRNDVIAFIPARGGSKSIPYKNILPVAGRPLIYWVLDAAVRCDLVDKVYVSTDDSQIAETVTQYGNDKVGLFSRSPATATDTASTESAMLEFAERHEFSLMVLIQATSPLLEANQLSEGISEFLETGADSLVSVVRQKRFLWEPLSNGIARPVNYDPLRRPRRQDFDGFLVENGAFYICSRQALLDTGSRLSGKIIRYEMPEETYHELDDPDDIIMVEHLLNTKKKSQTTKFSGAIPNIKLFLMDVDGVLTDAGMYYTEKGDELKKFNTRDGKGVELLRMQGIKTGIITSENTTIVADRAKKLKIDYLFQGVTDKLSRFMDLLTDLNIEPSEAAYIGDDINDVELLKAVGFSAAPADAVPAVKNVVDYICSAKGGDGCVREIINIIIMQKQQ